MASIKIDFKVAFDIPELHSLEYRLLSAILIASLTGTYFCGFKFSLSVDVSMLASGTLSNAWHLLKL